MNELVHWIIHSRFLSSARVSSVAGSGLPERMRSTAFALLGLTAAAGLALVAIFAQLSFPLLEPPPLPGEPTVSESVGEAQRARFGHGSGALVTALPAASPHQDSSSAAGRRSHGSDGSSTGTGRTAAPPTGVAAPVPVSTPETSEGNGGEPGGGSSPAPTAAPEPAPAAPSTPAPAPKPTGSTPPPVVAAPAPEPVAPGNSSSSAAAAHASERGIEASAKSVPSTTAPSAVPVETAAPPAPPGNAYAKGHDK